VCVTPPIARRLKIMNLNLKFKIIQVYGTQSDFAQHIGAGDSYVSRIIRERRNLDPITQKKWADALGCNPKSFSKIVKIETLK
jgi:plasmid maintenance system antidote protein VapI